MTDAKNEGDSGASRSNAGLGLRVLKAQMAAWFYDQVPAKQEIYRHRKTGGIYGVICNAARESDGAVLVVYRDMETGQRWVRPASEFNDGRFEKLPNALAKGRAESASSD